MAKERAAEQDERARAFVESFGENDDKASRKRKKGKDPSLDDEEQALKKRATFRGRDGEASSSAHAGA